MHSRLKSDMQRSPLPVLFLVPWLYLILTEAQYISPPDLSCLRSSPSDDGQAHITFVADVAGVRTLYVSRWSEDQRLVMCERITDPLETQRYGGGCDPSDSQGHEIIRRFNVTSLVAPGAPCALVSAKGEAEGKIRRKRGFVFPGTRWCGTGSSASRYDQLGIFVSTDRCCRDHDHCLHIIPSKTWGYGIFNSRFHTVSHCDCDQRFRQCLLNVNDSISKMVGISFFNVIKVPCFDFQQPQRCTERHLLGRCKVPKNAPHAILKSPHPYNNTGNKSESEKSWSTGDENQPVTKGAAITPHATSPKHEHACTTKDPPTGRSSSHGSNNSKGCEIHRNVSAVAPTEIPPVSESHIGTPSADIDLRHTSKSLPNDNSDEQKADTGKSLLPVQRLHIPPQATTAHYLQTSATQTPAPEQSSPWATTVATKNDKTVSTHTPCCGVPNTSRGDAFQSHCRSCLDKNVTHRMTTVRGMKTALQDLSSTTEPSQKQPTGEATAATPTITQRTTATPINQPSDSRLPWMHTSLPSSTKASSRLTRWGLRRQIALRNLTDYEFLCISLKHLDECRYKIRPLENKFGLQNNVTKTAYHCNCTSRMALQIESLKQPTIVPSLLMDFVSQYCFVLPKERKFNRSKSASPGFEKASDLLQALKKIEEKDTVGVRKSGYERKRGIPVRLYKRCLRLEREADVIAQLT